MNITRFLPGKWSLVTITLLLLMASTHAEDIPKIYSNIQKNEFGELFVTVNKRGKSFQYYAVKDVAMYSLPQMTNAAKGSEEGLSFDFNHQPLFVVREEDLSALKKYHLDNVEMNNFSQSFGFSSLAKEVVAVDSGLQKVFKRHGIALGKGTVSVVTPQKEWRVYDSASQEQYSLIKNANALEVWHRLHGILYFGLINFKDGKYPLPVYFKNNSAIVDGKAYININKNFRGKYDMVGWEQTGQGTIGYRVTNHQGRIIYDGKISFRGNGPFIVGASITEGPFVNLVDTNSAVISFTTNIKLPATVRIGNKSFSGPIAQNHEIKVFGLQPDTNYDYEVVVGDYSEKYSFTTSPSAGSRKPFVFAYASDSRSAQGGGERDVLGVNSYIMKKIMAVASHHNAAFMQFTGDMIDGYLANKQETMVQYSNWKRTIEPFAHYMPVYVGMGNHEALVCLFDDNTPWGISVDKFPWETLSAEQAFSEAFVLPENGLDNEDNSKCDPDPKNIDFPSYKENVYYYTHDNVAMVVLNSNYWYSPSLEYTPDTSGNLHAYIMDNQLAWLKETLDKLEQDKNIDHVFISQHTPAFPNGGHSDDDMWYSGKNKYRAYVNDKKVDEGIIERRDAYLLTLMRHPKVVGILCGDEHNYNRMHINKKAEIYPKDWDKPKITETPEFRSLWQINNGAAGAPYYAQEKLPWSEYVYGFTTQCAIVLFYVEGEKISMKVINPDTLSEIDILKLR